MQDCQWVENNLEAIFCETLTPELNQRARQHINGCASCRQEVEALTAVDSLVRRNFRRDLQTAQSPRVMNRTRVLGLSSAALATVAVLLFVVVRASQNDPVLPTVPSLGAPAPTASADLPATVPNSAPNDVKRAKPTAAPDRESPPVAGLATSASENGPDFLVIDPAGYSHTVDEYRGHIVVIGVWSNDQPQPTSNLERLYKSHASNTKIRFIGVSNGSQRRPANTTFPIAYNQGSKIFGARVGEFVLLNETGTIQLRGSLTTDFDRLRRALPGN
jgi:hypothetical protein